MLIDIFSIFDDCLSTWWTAPLIWAIPIIVRITIFYFHSFTGFTRNFLKFLVLTNFIPQSFCLKIRAFIQIFPILIIWFNYINFLGILPYTFSISSHIIFSLSFRLPFWLLLILSSFQKSVKKSFTIFLPSGTPLLLAPFLTIIELISVCVRPITLAIRLIANIAAGHIIINLIRTIIILIFIRKKRMIFLPIQIFYIIFEFSICFIQAYIFCLLLFLYSDDHQ